jgi:hypothetical protein
MFTLDKLTLTTEAAASQPTNSDKSRDNHQVDALVYGVYSFVRH